MCTKICSKCGIEKEVEQFYKRNYKRKDGTITLGYSSHCRECEKSVNRYNSERYKEYYKTYPKANRQAKSKKFVENRKLDGNYKDRWLTWKYGITEVEYNSMRAGQDYKCAICGLHEDNYNKPLHVDHCHETGRVRGLLCHICNLKLGIVKYDANFLKKAIYYLSND